MKPAETDVTSRVPSWGFIPLLFIPILLIAVVESDRARRGPFYAGLNQDPSYSYLIGSLRLAATGETNFFHHPGLPTQGIGAIVVMVGSTLRGGSSDLVGEVLTHPEGYLRAMQAVHLILASLGIAGLGLAGWRRGGPAVAVFLLAAPFACTQILARLSHVGPESTLFLIALAMTYVLLRIATAGAQQEGAMAVALGLLAALALASRVSAVPFLLIPLLALATWKARAVFAGTLALGLVLALLPMLGHTGGFAEWVSGLLRRTGAWGDESRSLVDPRLYLEGLASLFDRHQALFIVLALSAAVWGLSLRAESPAADNSARRVLGAVLAGQLALLLLVTKNPSSRYLVPATALIGLNLSLVWMLAARRRFLQSFRRKAVGAALVLAIPILLELPQQLNERKRHRRGMAGREAIASAIDRLPRGCTIARYYRASDPAFALHFGNRLPPRAFGEELTALYPGRVFYNHFRRRFESFNKPLEPLEIEARSPCLALHGHPRPELEPWLVARSTIEALYRVPSASEVALEAREPSARGSD